MTANGYLPTSYEFGEFRIDVERRLLFKGDERITLTPKAYETLFCLVANAGRVVDKDELMERVWPETVVEENNLNQNISSLRRVFGEKRGEHRYIATIPGRGYKFVAEVRVSFAAEDDTDPRESQSVIPSAPGRSGIVRAAVILVLAAAGVVLFFLAFKKNAEPSPSGPRTIAVLPFKPLVADHRDEVLEVGMADTLITRLGRNGGAAVLPLSSVRKYSGMDTDVLAAGRELGVDSVLTGSIQKWGDKIRVNVSLLNVADGTAIWNGTFDEKMTDIFAVQDSITGKVASSLSLKINPNGPPAQARPPTENAKAYELYLRGRFHYFRITPAEVERSIGYFRQATEADPNYALAYAALADAYRTQAIAAHRPAKEVCPLAKQLALRALELDPELADGYIVLGWVALFYDWDWAAAENYLNRAIALAPYNSDAYRARGHLYSILGRHDEAIADGRRASELAPLTSITRVLEAQYLYYAGRLDEAISLLREVEKIESTFWSTYSGLGRVLTLKQDYDAAIEAFRKAESLSGGSFEAPAQLAYVFGRAGRTAEAREVIAKLERNSDDRTVPHYFLAVAYNGLEERERVIGLLERSFAERESQMIFLKVDTRWDWLREDPAFADIERRMNFSGPDRSSLIP